MKMFLLAIEQDYDEDKLDCKFVEDALTEKGSWDIIINVKEVK